MQPTTDNKFKKTTLGDMDSIAAFFPLVTSRTCDFTRGGMFMWRDYYRMEHMIEDGVLYSRLRDGEGNSYYNLPLSDNIPDAVKRTVGRWRGTDGKIRFCTVPEEYTGVFAELYPHAKVTEQPDYSDYLYKSSDLSLLAGKKYSPQRNLISQFKRNHPDHIFAEIGEDNIDEVADFFFSSYMNRTEDGETESNENRMVAEVISNYRLYRVMGGALYAEGRMIGFSLGEKIGDTLYTHIEKADRTIKGAYQILANEFALHFGSDVKYINREEDMGDPGLRRAKNALHPAALLKKYVIEV